MQFTGHSLLVHKSDCTVGFYLVPCCQPSQPTLMEYATSTVFGMACLAGSKVNIQQINVMPIYQTINYALLQIKEKNLWINLN